MPEPLGERSDAWMELFKSHGVELASAILIAAFGWSLAAWSSRSVRSLGKRSAHVDATLVPILSSITRLAILTFTGMAVLEKFGVDTKSLFAVLGAAGLTIGLALKDTLSDVASGIVILVLRPFDVGDAVDVDGTTGVVDAIDVFQTKLTSFDGVPVVLPNSKVRSARVQNFTRARKRRIDLTVGVRTGTDLGQAIAALKDLLANEPRVLHDVPPLVDVIEVAEAKVTLLVRAWTSSSDFFATRVDLTRRLKERLDSEGISIAAPQRELHIVPRADQDATAPRDDGGLW